MSGYAVMRNSQMIPVHNLATALYLLRNGRAEAVIDVYRGMAIQK